MSNGSGSVTTDFASSGSAVMPTGASSLGLSQSVASTESEASRVKHRSKGHVESVIREGLDRERSPHRQSKDDKGDGDELMVQVGAFGKIIGKQG